MGRIRYIDAFECQFCFNTHITEEQANKCCGCKAIRINGFECKQCFEVYDNPCDARGCCPELKPMVMLEGFEPDPVQKYDASDEIMIGGISIQESENDL